MASRTGNKTADQKLSEYQEQITELAAKAMGGRINKANFINEHIRISNYYMRLLFILGGGDPDNQEAGERLQTLLNNNKKSARKLANEIYSGQYNVE